MMPACAALAAHPKEDEIEFSAIRAQGAGGQNVNKVSNAVHLRYDVAASSLPEAVKARLLAWRDQRISAGGVVVIKAQDHRSLERNRTDAIERLRALIAEAAMCPSRAAPPNQPEARSDGGSRARCSGGRSRRCGARWGVVIETVCRRRVRQGGVWHLFVHLTRQLACVHSASESQTDRQDRPQLVPAHVLSPCFISTRVH